MTAGLLELDTLRAEAVRSHTVIGDNANPATYEFVSRGVQLAVAHPPYLNSFDYLPVFSLELAWSDCFDEIWQGWDQPSIRQLEHRAWPATTDRVMSAYYEAFFKSVDAAGSVIVDGGVLAVVVGDATIRGELQAVHIEFWNGLKDRGWKPIEIWFRSTHYGIGKYAYSHRADYHGDAEKRDAIICVERSS